MNYRVKLKKPTQGTSLKNCKLLRSIVFPLPPSHSYIHYSDLTEKL